jgi:hypothetical protein
MMDLTAEKVFGSHHFSRGDRVVAARHKFHVGGYVLVRYRPDDPTVNKLDRTAWREL